MRVRCETCGEILERDDAHEELDDHNAEHWWCAGCCPVCGIGEDDDEISVTYVRGAVRDEP